VTGLEVYAETTKNVHYFQVENNSNILIKACFIRLDKRNVIGLCSYVIL
jgi:hypothetical protein